MTLPDLTDWLPFRLAQGRKGISVDWCYLGWQRLTEPFFDQSIERCLENPFNLLFWQQTPLEAFRELPAGLPPTGFIFHLSRCGSTLFSQSLASVSSNVVVSEASVIDSLLRPTRPLTENQRIRGLQGLINALGQRRQPTERYFFIKFDPWHTSYLPLIRQAFPTVPWIFMYRQPVEVLVSTHREGGGRMIPGVVAPEQLGLDFNQAMQMPQAEYQARLLAKICQAALENHKPEKSLLINYSQLPEAIWTLLPDFFQAKYSAVDLEGMRQRSRRNAKYPEARFEADSSTKREMASETIRQAARTWVEPDYDHLEMRRGG